MLEFDLLADAFKKFIRYGIVIVLALFAALFVYNLMNPSDTSDTGTEPRETPCEEYANAIVRLIKNCGDGANPSRAEIASDCHSVANPTSQCIHDLLRLDCASLQEAWFKAAKASVETANNLKPHQTAMLGAHLLAPECAR